MSYENGFKGTADFAKNQMTDWKVVSADKDTLKLRLTFLDPIWVSQNPKPCLVMLNFRDGQSFKSAGFGQTLAADTIKRVKLVK